MTVNDRKLARTPLKLKINALDVYGASVVSIFQHVRLPPRIICSRHSHHCCCLCLVEYFVWAHHCAIQGFHGNLCSFVQMAARALDASDRFGCICPSAVVKVAYKALQLPELRRLLNDVRLSLRARCDAVAGQSLIRHEWAKFFVSWGQFWQQRFKRWFELPHHFLL